MLFLLLSSLFMSTGTATVRSFLPFAAAAVLRLLPDAESECTQLPAGCEIASVRIH